MKVRRGIGQGVALLLAVGLFMGTAAANCQKVSDFDGLIFDAGSFPASHGMEGHLDRALKEHVEKVVLFPHPAATQGNKPKDLEGIFPDLVVRGNQPWSNSPAVIWPEPMGKTGLGRLEAELARYPDRLYLLGNIQRFDGKLLQRLVGTYKNLWIGYGKNEIELMLKSCADDELGNLMRAAQGRFVFASSGGDENWKNYKWTVRKLKKLLSFLPAEQAEALAYRNAESLYDLAVNAP